MEDDKMNNKEKKRLIRRVIDGFMESTREVHKESKTSFTAERKESMERHIDATTPRTFKERRAEQIEKEKVLQQEVEKRINYQPKN